MQLPQRTRAYNGPITEAVRWDDFIPRKDDIFICTPAKSGTTWTQAICAMLIFGRGDLEVQPGNISPWLDANFMPAEMVKGMLEAQTHRRYIKTHTALDGIRFFPECTYICVYRDPRDAFFSMVNHFRNMNDERVHGSIPPDLREGFVNWARAPYREGEAEQFALASWTNHFQSYWKFRDLPNIHIFHYADMKRDLAGSIQKIASAIGAPISDEKAREFSQAAEFSNMQKNAKTFAPGSGSGIWKEEAHFFRNGKSGQWRDVLTAEDLAIYDEALAKLLPPDQAAWLQNGSGGN